jgi:Berberine and berberine like
MDQAMTELRNVAPDAGSYVSKTNFFEPRWQTSYWGPNYPRLLSIKGNTTPRGSSSYTTARAAKNGAPMDLRQVTVR